MDNSIKQFLYILAFTSLLFFIRFNNALIVESSAINEIIYILFWIGASWLFIKSFALKQPFAKVLFSTFFGLATLIGAIFAFFSVIHMAQLQAHNGRDPRFQSINQVDYENKKIKAYRTNGGTTTAFGIVVRSEQKVFPGILLVNELFRGYPMDTVALEVINHSTLQILYTKENKTLLKEIPLDKYKHSFFTSWREFFVNPQ